MTKREEERGMKERESVGRRRGREGERVCVYV